jgi:hypothetical protein
MHMAGVEAKQGLPDCQPLYFVLYFCSKTKQATPSAQGRYDRKSNFFDKTASWKGL